jgi:predicted DCC family thiol-disulfide oxidoreductase YuxK
VVLYDADCGLCRWTLGKVLAWDRRAQLEPVALQDPAADRLLGGMDECRRMASWHLVAPDGTVHSAGSALPELLELLRGGRPLAAALRRFPRASERLYFAVANNRGALGRLLPRRAIDRASARIDERVQLESSCTGRTNSST